MTMNSRIDYKKLTEKELKLLILSDDDEAIDEHIRRLKNGEMKTNEIRTKTYTLEQIKKMAEEAKKKAS